MFHGRISPVIVDGCKGTTLKNFSIDWDTPFHHELLVIERDLEANSFVVEISLMKYGYTIKNGQVLFGHYDWQDPIGQNITFWPANMIQIRALDAQSQSEAASPLNAWGAANRTQT